MNSFDNNSEKKKYIIEAKGLCYVDISYEVLAFSYKDALDLFEARSNSVKMIRNKTKLPSFKIRSLSIKDSLKNIILFSKRYF